MPIKGKTPQQRLSIPRYPLRRGSEDIFLLIVWLWAEGLRTTGIAKDLGLSTRTVAGHLRTLRTRIGAAPPVYKHRLNGIVHVDMYCYKATQTKKPAKRPVLLGMMSAEGQLRLFVIARKTQEEIFPLIKAHISRDAVIVTNNSNVYSGLLRDGFPHLAQLSYRDLHINQLLIGKAPNLYYIWTYIRREMHQARGVRSGTFLQRVREVELRWLFRENLKPGLYKYAITLMNS